MRPTSKFLLVTRVGPNSLHQNWIGPDQTRHFDVFLSAYDPNVLEVAQAGVFYELRPGYKVAGYSGFLHDHDDLWRQYEYICFWDEDLEATTDSLNRMFRLCREGGFKIAQPALTPDSHYTFAACVQQRGWKLRHVSFVEMMCPVFRADILEQAQHLYHSKFETGIDIVWSEHFGDNAEDFAILDSASIRHTEPVGGRLEDNGFDRNSGYERQIDDVLRRYQVPWRACVPHSGVLTSGRIVRSKLILFLMALPVLFSVPLQRPISARLKFALVHLKHIAESMGGRLPRREIPAEESGTQSANAVVGSRQRR